MAMTLQSPGPGYRLLRLSDGSYYGWMPPEATAQHWQQAQAAGEAALDRKYMAQAEAQNAPVTTEGKVYSATAARPNTYYGHLMGWIDHNLGGNALNRSAAGQAAASALAPAIGSAARAATGALDVIPTVGAYDLGATGVNVAKHLATRAVPSLANVADVPTVVGSVRSLTGTPELPANASDAQKIAENLLASANPRQSLTEAALRTATSYGGGYLGKAVGGETGQFLGSLVGASPAVAVANRPVLSAARAAFGGEQAPEVAAAGQRLGVQPTFGMVASPTGRRFEKAVGAVPLVGGPIMSAQARAAGHLSNIQQNVAESLYGGAGLPPTVTPATVGADLISGARQGAANITQRAQDEQRALAANIGPNQPVNVRSVYQPAAQQAFTTSPTTYAPLAARLAVLRDMAVQAQTPRFQAVSGAMPPGSAPYQRVMNFRSDLGADIPGVSGMSGGVQKNLYGRLTDALRAAAVAKDPALGPAFDYANENYQRIMGQGGERAQLEAVGGEPVRGYSGMAQPGGTTLGEPFRGGKDEGSAFTYLTSNLNSPSSLDVFSNPTIVPNDYWRRVAGGYLSTLGQTKEGTYRPDIMAQQWNKIDPQVQQQLFAGPTGTPYSGVSTMGDVATLGQHSVVPIERAGLTNTAGAVLASHWLLGHLGNAAPAAIGLASGMESPTFVNAMSGQYPALMDVLYRGQPQAIQTIQQYQQNPAFQQ